MAEQPPKPSLNFKFLKARGMLPISKGESNGFVFHTKADHPRSDDVNFQSHVYTLQCDQHLLINKKLEQKPRASDTKSRKLIWEN